MSVAPVEIPEYGGCLWPIDPACKTADWNSLDEDVKLRALALASSTLRRLTGYRVGGCPILLRPIPDREICWIPYDGLRVPGAPFLPTQNINGQWINLVAGNGPQACEIALPPPVNSVQEVKVDGDVLAYEDYQIDNGNLLTWVGGGECPWPGTQDITLPDTEVGTFSVTYWNSYPVDSTGAYAVGLLAVEFAKACMGGKCRLPANVISLTRGSATFELQGGAFPGGFTGIREIDAYIALWNPAGLQREATVWSPGQRKDRHNTSGYPVGPGRTYDGGSP